LKPLIVLLTDFGYRDPYVGVMKGVIKSINPTAEIIDLTHGVTRHDILEAAVTLLVSARYFPRNTIFVCVVDPGVGSERRALLIKTRNYYLVGPDNGCLTLLADFDGVESVIDISETPFSLREKSYTFHGRDLFAPVAAYLSLGYNPSMLGRLISYDQVVKISIPKPQVKDDSIEASVLYIDIYGNVMTNITSDLVEKLGFKLNETLTVKTKDRIAKCRFVKSFSHVAEGEYACYINSWGFFEIAVNKGDASRMLGVNRGDMILITGSKVEQRETLQ